MRFRILIITAALMVMTCAVFWPVQHHLFLDFDDNIYVTENLYVQGGITLGGAVYAFTTLQSRYWIPMTWMSHMLDCQLYDMNPTGHHLTSLGVHAANVIFLFLLLSRLTASPWRSAFVAAVFAVHPLTVESVAWIAERNNVLSVWFGLIAIGTYVRYTEKPALAKYFWVVLAMTASLMSKPALVTLPLILLLLDFWPLKRFECRPTIYLLYEKLPLCALAGLFSIITLIAEPSTGTLNVRHDIPFGFRLGNAVVSYMRYIEKFCYPVGLSIFYPHPGWNLPVWQAITSSLALVGISVWAIISSRRYPYFAVGWFWYLVSLLPVIGILQIGRQAMADRYAYFPLIGLGVIVAWGVPALLEKWRYQTFVLSAAAAGGLIAFTIGTESQLRHWQNSKALFEHAIQVTTDNYLAHYNVGNIFLKENQFDEAASHYSEAVRIKPDYFMAHHNLGMALMRKGDTQEAIGHFSEAIRIRPNYALAHNSMGYLLAKEGRFDEALSHFYEAARLDPQFTLAQQNILIIERMKSLSPKNASKNQKKIN